MPIVAKQNLNVMAKLCKMKKDQIRYRLNAVPEGMIKFNLIINLVQIL